MPDALASGTYSTQIKIQVHIQSQPDASLLPSLPARVRERRGGDESGPRTRKKRRVRNCCSNNRIFVLYLSAFCFWSGFSFFANHWHPSSGDEGKSLNPHHHHHPSREYQTLATNGWGLGLNFQWLAPGQCNFQPVIDCPCKCGALESSPTITTTPFHFPSTPFLLR